MVQELKTQSKSVINTAVIAPDTVVVTTDDMAIDSGFTNTGDFIRIKPRRLLHGGGSFRKSVIPNKLRHYMKMKT